MKKIVIANWKMNPETDKEAETLFKSVARAATKITKTEVVICPPFVYIKNLKKISKKIALGAQNSFWTEKGAFTGEVSPSMLSNLGVKYVILGHSERRAMGESDKDVNKKIKASIAAGLRPIVCVGENTRDTSHGYFDIVKRQITECLQGVPKNLISKIIIAYEPVWAISTTPDRRDATAADCLEMVIFIRKVLSDASSPQAAALVRIIYGGSVNERDAENFIKEGRADGLLVGKASLDAKKFSQIVKIMEDAIN